MYIKDVDTSVDVKSLADYMKKEGVTISEIKRLTKRYTGRPTQVIKVKCDQKCVHTLLNTHLVVNDRHCRIESERQVKVIRCYHCQALGHVARNCANARRCEICAQNHNERQGCLANDKPCCVNCMGNHPSSSSLCPAFRSRYEGLSKQHSECKHFYPIASANITEIAH